METAEQSSRSGPENTSQSGRKTTAKTTSAALPSNSPTISGSFRSVSSGRSSGSAIISSSPTLSGSRPLPLPTRLPPPSVGTSKPVVVRSGTATPYVLARQEQAQSFVTPITLAKKTGSTGQSTRTPSTPSISSKSVTSRQGNAARNSRSGGSSGQSTLARMHTTQQRSSTSRPSFPQMPLKLIGPIANLPGPARKAGSSNQPIRKQAQILTPATALDHFIRKSATQPKPLWQLLDQDYEERSRKLRRDELGGAARRISSTSARRAQEEEGTTSISVEDVGRTTARIGPGLKLRIIAADGQEEEESSEEEPRYLKRRKRNMGSPPVKVPTEVIGGRIAFKSAARKVKTITSPPASDSEGGSTMDTESDDNDEDQLELKGPTPKLFPPSTTASAGVPSRLSSSPDVMILDGPPPAFAKKTDPPILKTAPVITIPLPQLKPDPENELNDHAILYDIGNNTASSAARSHHQAAVEPQDELLDAIAALTLGSIRMHVTKQLPFRLKNLRKGFRARCEALHVPIFQDLRKGEISLSVRYEHVGTSGEIAFESNQKLNRWLCPLCTLFGKFETKEMLDCHMKWDHTEIFWEWDEVVDEVEDEYRQSWLLTLNVPEVVHFRAPAVRESTVPEFSSSSRPSQQPQTPERAPTVPPASVSRTPVTSFSSPLPFVAISPTTPRQLPPLPTRIARSLSTSAPIEAEAGSGGSRIAMSPLTTPRESSTSLPPSPPPSTSRSRSLTATSLTATATTETLATVTPSVTFEERTASPFATQLGLPRYPTPPPRSNPRGPAAQKPYLPAISEYNGPTVWYSCRPGGECLFDLLGTLPMEEFGLLAWEVIDREEEIYESDDIREEYKIMHALWARWIMLHRPLFISNYFKGTKTFVDKYWRMIHRAAGWDALRYWLLLLLANRFLNGHELAQLLLHYEELTGMTKWYD